MRNSVQLITYADRLGGGDLRQLRELLQGPLGGLFGGVHILPFFDPIDGADTGFDPVDHLRVDHRLGSWDDIQEIAKDFDVVADLIVNHISADSHQFQDFLRNGAASDFAGMFLTEEKVFPGGASEAQLAQIYRPRPTPPFTERALADGNRHRFWTTFTEQQIDLDVTNPRAIEYLKSVLQRLANAGVKLVRLDAVGYAVKTPGTSCFMTPESYAFIDEISGWSRALGMQVLVEIHSHYRHQIEISRHVDYVYDFALPPLILHTLFESNAAALKSWLAIAPRNAITVLDTHDGIGVMDVGPDWTDRSIPGLIAPEYVDSMVERIHENSDGVSRRASRHDVGNLDLYQVNCTFYDALGRSDTDYLLARLVQCFVPGIPQMYYVGVLAGENDAALLDETSSGRDVNRSFYSRGDVVSNLQRPVVRSLMELIRFRNAHAAFEGAIELIESQPAELRIRRSSGEHWAELFVDFATRTFHVEYSTDGGPEAIRSLRRA